jgi:hypothetical protein
MDRVTKGLWKKTALRFKIPRLLEYLDPLSATISPVEGSLLAERGTGAVSPPIRAGALRTPARGANGRRAGAPGPNGVR